MKILAILLLLPLRGNGQDTSFILQTESPQPYTPTSIGNGLFSLTTSPTSLDPALSFDVGVYDHTPGDVPRIAALPEWNGIDVYDGERWLADVKPDASSLRAYHQRLNMLDGLIVTTYEWIDGQRTTQISVETFVSRSDPHLAVITIGVTPRYDGRIELRFPLRGRPAPARLNLALLDSLVPDASGRMPSLWQVWYPGFMNVLSRTTDRRSGMIGLSAGVTGDAGKVGEASVVSMPAALGKAIIRYSNDSGGVAIDLTFNAKKGKEYLFHKYVGIAASFESAAPDRTAREAVSGALSSGYNSVKARHVGTWHELWNTDIVVEGSSELQSAIHAMMFYLLCCLREGSSFSIPPMGNATSGYYGHVFWDADTYMFPPILLMHPRLARSMVMFRARTLPAAERNAAANGNAGAKYPWEADDRGEETTPRFAAQNASREIHITGDVANAQWQYYLATGDRSWLAKYGFPVISNAARYWASRAVQDGSRDRWEVRDVVSVSEGLIGIDNDAYTNAVARTTLEEATKAAEVLRIVPDPAWARIAEKMYIPYDSVHAAHPTYEHAPDSTLGSVVTLLEFPLRIPMSDEARRNDLAYATRRFFARGGGAMMIETFYPILAAEARDTALFESLVPGTYEPHLRGPFLALAETPSNDAINFLTGAGGFLQQVIFGYTGLRLESDGLVPRFPPLLPRIVKRLTLKNFSVRGKRVTYIIDGVGVRRIPR